MRPILSHWRMHNQDRADILSYGLLCYEPHSSNPASPRTKSPNCSNQRGQGGLWEGARNTWCHHTLEPPEHRTDRQLPLEAPVAICNQACEGPGGAGRSKSSRQGCWSRPHKSKCLHQHPFQHLPAPRTRTLDTGEHRLVQDPPQPSFRRPKRCDLRRKNLSC